MVLFGKKQSAVPVSPVSPVTRGKYNPPREDLTCEQCGGCEQLAVIFQRLLCRHCALVFIRTYQTDRR